MSNENKVLKTVERTFFVLELLSASNREMSLDELSLLLSVNKTTLHALLNTLVILGYVINNKGNYSPNIRLSLLAGRKNGYYDDLIQKFRPKIEKIADLSGNTCLIAIKSGSHHYVILDYIEKEYKLKDNKKRSPFVSMVSSATGNIFLAYDKKLLSSMRKGNYITPIIEDKIRKIQEKGYALDIREVDASISCVAFPIFDKNKFSAVVTVVTTDNYINESICINVKKFLNQDTMDF